MNIVVTGGSKRRRDLAKEVLLITSNHLTKPFNRRLKIQVKFRSSSDCDASQEAIDKFSHIIIINPTADVRYTVELLIHEFTHIKQTLSDGCNTDASGTTYWHGKRYCNKSLDPRNSNYWTAPWEIEAFGMQKTLSMFIDQKLTYGTLDDYTWLNCGNLIKELKSNKFRL